MHWTETLGKSSPITPSIICKSNNRVTFPVQHAAPVVTIYGCENKINNNSSGSGLVRCAQQYSVRWRSPLSGMTGQPSQSCEVTMVSPGNAINVRGSAFNPNGTAQAVYANPTSQGGTSSGNTHVVAQYDVACFQQTARVAAGHGRH